MTPITPLSQIPRVPVVKIGERFPSDCRARLYRGETKSGGQVLVSLVPPALARSAVIKAGLPPVSVGPVSSGDFYVAYDIPCGESLAERIRRRGKLPWGVAARAFRPVIARLAAVHRRDRIYGEMCPEELVFDGDGHLVAVSRELRKLSRAFDRRQGSKPRMSVLPFLAPERARGEYASAKSDVFSAGAILFFAIAGTRAFDGCGFLELLHRVQTVEVPTLREIDPNIPRIVSDVAAAALRKDPARRPTAEVLAKALRFGIRRVSSEEVPWPDELDVEDREPIRIRSDGPSSRGSSSRLARHR